MAEAARERLRQRAEALGRGTLVRSALLAPFAPSTVDTWAETFDSYHAAAATSSSPDAERPPPSKGRVTMSTPDDKGVKGSFEDEAPTHHAEDATAERRSRVGSGSPSARHYMTPRTKVSTRLKAQTARDAERERHDRAAVASARQSARLSAKHMHATARERPLKTETPPPQHWRQWPSGTPEARDVNHLWAEAEANALGTAGSITPQGQSPASPQPLFGSQRPLSTKERGYQLEKAMEQRARRHMQELKAQAMEQEAVEELRSKHRRTERLRAKQRSARGGMSRTERKAVQQRLYASPRRQAVGSMYS